MSTLLACTSSLRVAPSAISPRRPAFVAPRLAAHPLPPRSMLVARNAPDGSTVAAAILEVSAFDNEEVYYDSDYECPTFIPECPTLIRMEPHCPDGEHGCYALFEAEVGEREATIQRMVHLEGIIFPEAPNVPYRG